MYIKKYTVLTATAQREAQDNEKKSSTVKRVLKYIGKYKAYLAASLILALITVAGQLYIPILQGQAIDRIIATGNVDFAAITRIIIIILITVGAVSLLQWIMNICNNRITYSVVHDIRRDAFEKLQRLPVRYADSHPTGEIVSKVISDADQFADGLLMGFTQFFTGLMTIIGTLAFMLMINWKITLVVVLVTPLSFLFLLLSPKGLIQCSISSPRRGASRRAL